MSKKLMGVALLASLVLAGCGTLSDVDENGRTDKPVFPDVEDVTFDAGSYPNIDNLRLVQQGIAGNGMTRDQLYNLLGRPHFSEGFRVREWDYLFHFNTPEGVKTCQYKVLFDDDLIARSEYWAPEGCGNFDAKPQVFSLSGDVGFAFGSAVLTTVGQDTVRNIAGQLKQAPKGQQVTVSGHTDYIGDDAANLRLSQRRAEAVRQALAAEGIPANTIQAQGFGEDRPVVQCDQQNRNDLIACLAPNRRVDIEVQGK